MSGIDIKVEWIDAPGVVTPELAATWARYELWTGDSCITQVESSDFTLRRSVYGSLYPLAEWITTNWWLLTRSIRPSATPYQYWTWSNVQSYQWLRQHNVRAAGNGMSWPDLTVVPEGALTCVRWSLDREPTLGRIKFMSSGMNLIDAVDAETSLARIVTLTLERLSEEGLHKTRLAEDWAALGRLADDEKDFCATAARLGVDPFDVSDELADAVIDAAETVPPELADDFFANADPDSLAQAAAWTRKAERVAKRISVKAERDLRGLYAAIDRKHAAVSILARPWDVGYTMARDVRQALNVGQSSPFNISPWMALGRAADDSRGIQGLAVVERDRFGLVLGGPPLSKPGRLFAQARALGRTLTSPTRRSFLLSSTRDYEGQVAGAFAAELLAPAAGIREFMMLHGVRDDLAFEATARHFGVSPILVRHQYDNQLARTS